MFNPLETKDFDSHFLNSLISNDTFLQDFLVILKHSLQNYKKILKNCFLGKTYIVIYLACSNT